MQECKHQETDSKHLCHSVPCGTVQSPASRLWSWKKLWESGETPSLCSYTVHLTPTNKRPGAVCNNQVIVLTTRKSHQKLLPRNPKDFPKHLILNQRRNRFMYCPVLLRHLFGLNCKSWLFVWDRERQRNREDLLGLQTNTPPAYPQHPSPPPAHRSLLSGLSPSGTLAVLLLYCCPGCPSASGLGRPR